MLILVKILQYMNERITLLRASGLATPKSAVVVFQPFLHEIEGEWYDSAVIGVQVSHFKRLIFSLLIFLPLFTISKRKFILRRRCVEILVLKLRILCKW